MLITTWFIGMPISFFCWLLFRIYADWMDKRFSGYISNMYFFYGEPGVLIFTFLWPVLFFYVFFYQFLYKYIFSKIFYNLIYSLFDLFLTGLYGPKEEKEEDNTKHLIDE